MKPSDALIIGGGPAGSAAAILLAKAGWGVTLIERKEFPRRKVCGEYLSATNWPLLHSLGIAESFADLAGPPVRETAIYVGNQIARAPLPRPRDKSGLWGRALSREHLDSLLLEQAAKFGVQIRQPARCIQVERADAGFRCQIESQPAHDLQEIGAHVVIAAHGSWDLGDLPTERQPTTLHSGDLFAFKAHFQNAALPLGLMPLLSFMDGYGGMTHCDGGRVSLSCCIRRSRLERLARQEGQSAGDTVLSHIFESCPALRPVLESATLAGPWLSAGPIRPGIRRCYADGVFIVGNAAGEAHPVVAEGISMAMQSAWLLAESLSATSDERTVARNYTRAWRRSFAPRIRAAAAIAHWAMQPRLVAATLPFLQTWPKLLTLGAWLSGKSKLVVQTT
ncbi:MAG: FAD-dependent monooxygenase [Planctomycetales bacterium]|nr:FAD-dependent monooxygenase [Planctomycetales bacterium]